MKRFKSDLNDKLVFNTWLNGMIPYEIDKSFAKSEDQKSESYFNVLKSAFEELFLFYNLYHRQVVHQLMHAIGFRHEHQRNHRNKYIQIHYKNIKPEYIYGFIKHQFYDLSKMFSFDFDSILLY